LPVESDAVAHEGLAQNEGLTVDIGTGIPELKFIPQCRPNIQLFHSPWEKQKKGREKNKPKR
jgi:hypothetical protein